MKRFDFLQLCPDVNNAAWHRNKMSQLEWNFTRSSPFQLKLLNMCQRCECCCLSWPSAHFTLITVLYTLSFICNTLYFTLYTLYICYTLYLTLITYTLYALLSTPIDVTQYVQAKLSHWCRCSITTLTISHSVSRSFTKVWYMHEGGMFPLWP